MSNINLNLSGDTMTKINNSSYFERLHYMNQMRQASGQFGDKRDNPLFTSSGREAIYQQIWNQMGGYGNFKEASMMARMQKEANQTQYTMMTIQSLGSMMQSLGESVKSILSLFGK